MNRLTREQRLQIVEIYLEKNKSIRNVYRALRPIYGQHNRPSEQAIRKVIGRFRTNGTLLDLKPTTRRKNVRSEENIAAVARSVKEDGEMSIRRRSQLVGLCPSTTWKILREDLGLNAQKIKILQELKPNEHSTPDPQENRLNDTSPSSSASAPRSNVGRPARRLSRTNSNASDKSVTSNASSPGRRSTSSKVESPVKTGARRKLRSTSTEEKPESKSTRRVKEPTPDISDGSDTDNSVISTRSRKSTTKSDDSNSSNKRKRKVVAKTILPGIKEENLEGANGSPAQNTRNTRGKKNVQQ